MAGPDVLTAVRSALETIADSLDNAAFTILGEERDDGEKTRAAVVETVRKYLLHRLREPDAPLVAALVGLSGVGKSTILNSLAQDRVSATGVLRPTTSHGVLWAHRDHAARYWTEFVGRVTDQIGATTDVVIGDDPLTKYLTFVDTPPIELAPEAATTSAADALMFADLCLFVTSVARYADAAPLELLDLARARGIPTLFVLNRLPAETGAKGELIADFAIKLVDAGLLPEADPGFIFGVDDIEVLRWHGGVGPEPVRALRRELSELSDSEFRVTVIDETAEATMLAVADRAESVARLLKYEHEEAVALLAAADRAYASAGALLDDDLERGTLSSVAERDGWERAVLDLTGVVTRAAGGAAEESAQAWLSRPGGERLLANGFEGLRRHGAGAADEAGRLLDEWQQGLAARSRTRLRRKGRRVRRRVDELWRAAVDPAFELKRWRKDRSGAVDAARGGLAAAFRAALDADAGRFRRRLGTTDPSDIADKVIAASRYLRGVPGSSEEPDAAPSHEAPSNA